MTPRTLSASDCFARITALPASRALLEGRNRGVRYGELKTHTEALAGLLRERGVGLGDRVVISSHDDTQVALLFVGLVCNGITVVNLDPNAAKERAQSLIAKAAPALVIADDALLRDWALAAQLQTIPIAPAVSTGGALGRLLGSKQAAAGLTAMLQQVTPASPPTDIPPETLAYILFTSGTTNQPKGVCISHRALFAHVATLSRLFGYNADSRILNTLMLSHTDGMTQGPVIAFYNSATVLRPTTMEVSAIEALLDAIYQLRATHLVAVPTLMTLMLRLGSDQRDTFAGGDFRQVISCGAQLEARLWEDFEKVFGVSIINLYGLTETVTGGCFAGHTPATRVPGSIGRPVDCDVRIVDALGADVTRGEPGELLMRGDLVMSGYFADPAMTDEVLRDGWLRTGDIARQDDEGNLWIVGRAKNIIIRGGFNIHPEEVTEALNRHSGVREAVTFGVPDASWGELVVAMVAGDAGLSEAELARHCARYLESHKIPSRIVIAAELPKGRSGKVVLAQARELFAQLSRGVESAPASHTGNVEERFMNVAAKCFNVEPAALRLSDTPEDIPGWDSLTHLELVVALEAEFNLKLTPRQIMAIDRLDHALQLVMNR